MSEPTLSIDTTSHKSIDVITINGRVDSSNYNELDQVFSELLENKRNQFVLNMADVSYLSSAGLRAMVTALRECKKRGGDVRVAEPSERVKEVLDLSGLDLMFTTYPDNEHAIGSF